MDDGFLTHISQQLSHIERDGLLKHEHIITSPQSALIDIDGRKAINLCANNYLGLSHHASLEAAASEAIAKWGYGLSSVRFICGTQGIHQQLEEKLSGFLRMEASILYSSCFDANGGLFECLLGPEDAVISDALNHASIIDGIRLSKAQRFRYSNNDMSDLEVQLKAAHQSRFRMIATDGVFSMDGTVADLASICELADRYKALVMVDDSHAVGFIGPGGRGTPAACGVENRVDLVTGTFGKALGGASGGYISGRKAVVSYLRQRSRPYLFSNSLAPVIAATTLKALQLVKDGDDLRTHLHQQTLRFRSGLRNMGFPVPDGEHPIVPIMLGEAGLAQEMSKRLFEEGVYVVGFSYPVVPMGKARIRCQISAAHQSSHIDTALAAFESVGSRLKIIPPRLQGRM